jgi:hypothetical protein
VQKEQIRYRRADGIDLTATLLLPPGYQPRRDGPLPMLMWAYPQEFRSASAASQTTGSPYRFNAAAGRLRCWRWATRCSTTRRCRSSAPATPSRTTATAAQANAEAVDEVQRRCRAPPTAIGGHCTRADDC